MATNPAQSRYLADTVSTATPAQLVVMLYDRLGLDLMRAGQAIAAGDRSGEGENLLHGQQILAELLSSLRTGQWDGAENLAGLYGFLIHELMGVRIEHDIARLANCAELVRGLRDSWAEAASQLNGESSGRKAEGGADSAWVA